MISIDEKILQRFSLRAQRDCRAVATGAYGHTPLYSWITGRMAIRPYIVMTALAVFLFSLTIASPKTSWADEIDLTDAAQFVGEGSGYDTGDIFAS